MASTGNPKVAKPQEAWSLLLAEDDDGDAELVRLPFRREPAAPEFCVVPTVHEALSAIRSRTFDIIICDLRLRDGSGLDIVRHIREADLNVPVLMLTGFGSEHEAVEAIRNGADDYFVKNRDTYARLPKITSSLVRSARSEQDRKRSTAELKRATERFRDYAEAASDWFWETDAADRLTFVSGGGSTGQELEALLGQPIWALADADDNFSRERHEREIAGRRLFRDFVYSRRDEAGDTRTIRLSGKPFHSADGQFLGYRGVGTDITHEIRTEETLRIAKVEAEKASLAKSRFLAVMSHELRTPLNAIIGFSESLIAGIAGPTTDKAREYLGDIRNAGRHLLNVVNDVLDLSKIEAGHYGLATETVDLEESLNESVQFLTDLAIRSGVGLELGDVPRDVRFPGDRRAVRQILINILSNAIKFTQPGGDVAIAAAADAPGVTICVRDNGVGIPADKLEEVLKPFHQVDNLLTRKYEGTGLGLPIAKGLIEAHGGGLRIESEIGRGTAVYLTFPHGAA